MIKVDKNIEFLSKLLDLTSVQNKVIANNIANANTEGYKKLEVEFQKELQKAIKSDSIAKVNSIKEKIVFSNDKSTSKDGNNVDVDREMIEFFKSSDRHNLYLEILSKKFKSIISAIAGK